MTPFEHEFAVTDVTDGSLIFKATPEPEPEPEPQPEPQPQP